MPGSTEPSLPRAWSKALEPTVAVSCGVLATGRVGGEVILSKERLRSTHGVIRL